MGIGDRIRSRRIELNMTQDELAKKMGYKSRSSVNKLELSRELPSKKIAQCAAALDCLPSYLMGWEDKDFHVVPRVQIEIEPNFDSDFERFQRLSAYSLKIAEAYGKAPADTQKAVELILKTYIKN